MGPQLVRCGKRLLLSMGRYTAGPSMGPQLVRCGKSSISRFIELAPASFNGAATCSLRKGIRRFGGRCQHQPFNGAATCSLRKVAGQCVIVARVSPSMGPQLVRCGKHMIAGSTDREVMSFNGAATCSLRKDASMIDIDSK